MQNDNDVHTIIDSNGIFSFRDNYKYDVPLLIKGNERSLSEIAISLCMARDSEYQMPNNLRVYLSSWNNQCTPVTIDLTRIISEHYTSHLRALFPTQNVLDACLKEQVTNFVRYHTDAIPDTLQVKQYLNSLWKSIPPEDAPANDIRWEMGNGALGDNFEHAHWFTLPHLIVAIPPLQLLASTVGDSIRRLSGDLILEVTSGSPSLTRHDRMHPDTSPSDTSQVPFPPYTCGAFRLSVDVARQNPLNDELDLIRNDIKKLTATQEKHEGRLNGHDMEIKKHEGRLNGHDMEIKKHEGRLNGHDIEIAILNTRIGDEVRTLNTRIGDEVRTLNTRIGDEVRTLNTRIGDEIRTLNDLISASNARIKKLEKWRENMGSISVTYISVTNSHGADTILIDGEEGDIKLL